MPYYFIAAYITLSILLAYLGRNARLRFWGVLLASLILSPLVVGFILLFFGTTKSKRETVYRVKSIDPKKKSSSSN